MSDHAIYEAAVLAAFRNHRSRLDEFDIRDATGMTPEQVTRAVEALVIQGFLRWSERTGFRLSPDTARGGAVTDHKISEAGLRSHAGRFCKIDGYSCIGDHEPFFLCTHLLARALIACRAERDEAKEALAQPDSGLRNLARMMERAESAEREAREMRERVGNLEVLLTQRWHESAYAGTLASWMEMDADEYQAFINRADAALAAAPAEEPKCATCKDDPEYTHGRPWAECPDCAGDGTG